MDRSLGALLSGSLGAFRSSSLGALRSGGLRALLSSFGALWGSGLRAVLRRFIMLDRFVFLFLLSSSGLIGMGSLGLCLFLMVNDLGLMVSGGLFMLGNR